MPLLSAETHSHWDVLEVTLSTETLRDVFCPRARTRRILFPEMFIPVDSDSLLHFSKAHVGVVMQEWSSQEKRKKKVICDPDGFLSVLMEVGFVKQPCSPSELALHCSQL